MVVSRFLALLSKTTPQPAPDLVISGSWDRTFSTWDPRAPPDVGAAATVECPGKVYAMALCGADTLVVGTSERHVQLFDLRQLGHDGRGADAVLQRRESSLKHQTRIIRAFPDGSGFATGSTEGRIAIDFVDPNPAVQARSARGWGGGWGLHMSCLPEPRRASCRRCRLASTRSSATAPSSPRATSASSPCTPSRSTPPSGRLRPVRAAALCAV